MSARVPLSALFTTTTQKLQLQRHAKTALLSLVISVFALPHVTQANESTASQQPQSQSPLEPTLLASYLTTFDLNIPAKPLADALYELTQASNYQIIYQSQWAAGKTSKAIKGEFNIKEALAIVLQNTGLTYRIDNGTISLVVANENPSEVMTVISSRLQYGFYGGGYSELGQRRLEDLETPQSIQVLDNDSSFETGALSLDEIVEKVSGIEFLGSSQGLSNQLLLRGFIEPAILVDGMRAPSPTLTPELSEIEKIEVIKGPASVVHGQLEPGGLINVVRKKPLFESQQEFSATWGTHNLFRTHFDFTGAINGRDDWAQRLITTVETSDSFRDVAHHTKISVTPMIRFEPDDRTRIDFIGGYRERTGNVDTFLFPDYVFNKNPRLNAVPYNRFYGEPWNSSELYFNSAVLNYERAIGDASVLSASYRYQDQRVNDEYAYVLLGIPSVIQQIEEAQDNNFVSSVLNLLESLSNYVVRSAVGFERNSDQQSIVVNFESDFKLFNHPLHYLVGGQVGEWQEDAIIAVPECIEKSRQIVQFVSCIWPGISDGISLFDFLSPPSGSFSLFDPFDPVYGFNKPGLTDGVEFFSKAEFYSYYFQSFYEINEHWYILAGARKETIKVDANVIDRLFGFGTIQEVNTTETLSSRLGLLYRVTQNWSLFSNFNRAENTTINQIMSQQEEVGVKANFLDDDFTITLTGYTLENEIPFVTGEDSLIVAESFPSRESKGIDLDFSGQPFNFWKFSISHSYQNPRLTKSDSTRNDLVGKRPRNVSLSVFNLWNSLQLTGDESRGHAIGIGVRHVGSRYNDNENTQRMHSYNRLDLAWYYKNFHGWDFALHIKNALDEEYLKGSSAYNFAFNGVGLSSNDEVYDFIIDELSTTVLNPAGVVPGEPRTFTLRAQIEF